MHQIPFRHPLFVRTWHCIAACCIFIFLAPLIASKAFSHQGGISIDSFRVIKTTPQSVDVELVGDNDGSKGIICLGIIAKSKDGSVRSNEFPPLYIAAGQQLHITARVMRPQGLKKQQTDYLMVMVYQCGKQTILMRKFAWIYDWPETQNDISAGTTEASANLDSVGAWQAFNENLQEEDFGAIDELMRNWNNPGERDQNGEWKLDGFRSTFLNYSTESRDWQGDFQRIQKWHEFNPKSTGAAIAEARYWAAYAWHIRGSELNTNVDPVAMKMFIKRMKLAEKALKDSKSFAADNPLWYEAYLDIAVATRRSDKFIEELFNEAIRKQPYFQPLYVDMARHWAPMSGDKADWQKVDALVNKAVSLTTDLDGISNYARLYTQINHQQKLEFDIFQDSYASWMKMRDSFRELVKRYPSDDNLNEFAVFACHAGDRETYLKIRIQIQGRVVPNKWPGNYSLDTCDHMFMQYS